MQWNATDAVQPGGRCARSRNNAVAAAVGGSWIRKTTRPGASR